MESVNFPLSNVQLELLKLFSRDIGDNDLKEINRCLFIQKITFRS